MMINFLCLLFLGTFGWGISLYLIKILLVSISPSDIVLYRMIIGSISLFAIAIMVKVKKENIKILVIDGIVVGTFNMTIPCYLISYAAQNVSSSIASIINGLTPAITFIVGVTFFSNNNRISLLNIFSILLGFIGMVIINNDIKLSVGSTLDLLALVAACVSYGINANYFKFYARSKSPILVAAMASLISAISMLIITVFKHSPSHWNLPSTGSQIMALLWLGVVGTGLSLYIYCELIRRAGAVYASMVTYLMAAMGVLMGTIFLNESMSLLTIVGCILITISFMLYNHSELLSKFLGSRHGEWPVASY